MTGADAVTAAALFAVDSQGLGGVRIRARPGPARDRWIAQLRAYLPAGAPVRRVPLHVSDSRLLGGLDLAATLRSGKPIAERGLLAETDGGLLLLAMAERITPAHAAQISAVLDAGEVALERDGFTLRHPARLAVLALDESLDDEDGPPRSLCDRCAFELDLEGMAPSELELSEGGTETLEVARALFPRVQASPAILEALCATAYSMGIDSARAPVLALRAARAAAALEGRLEATEDDAALAARLVFSSRARFMPTPQEEAPPAPPPESEDSPSTEAKPEPDDQPLEDRVLEAIAARIPAGLLAQLREAGVSRHRTPNSGRSGALRAATRRGRPTGIRRTEPRAGARLNLVETLRAAAPWQRLRRARRGEGLAADHKTPLIQVRPEDFHVTRFRQRTQTVAIFAVDASGSAALHRLAEAKGAVELLLADCYVRRDKVALIAFRGRAAQLLLPPTRSLVRAKKCLAGLPGGGGTPLASGLDAAGVLAEAVRRQGATPLIIVLTDGRANVARDGSNDRAVVEAEVLACARQLRALGLSAMLIDVSAHPRPMLAQIAAEMGARYLPLPQADAHSISRSVKREAQRLASPEPAA